MTSSEPHACALLVLIHLASTWHVALRQLPAASSEKVYLVICSDGPLVHNQNTEEAIRIASLLLLAPVSPDAFDVSAFKCASSPQPHF